MNYWIVLTALLTTVAASDDPRRLLGRKEHRRDKPTTTKAPPITLPLEVEGQDRTVQAIIDRLAFLETRRAQEEPQFLIATTPAPTTRGRRRRKNKHN